METIYNWGLYPKIEADIIQEYDSNELKKLVKNKDTIIARGNGRCYGDSSLQTTVISTLKLNKILEFDTINGIIKTESGVLLSDLLNVILPEGYFLPVTPGTKFVSVGGAVASNIHGKNHHKEGAISSFIQELEIITENGESIRCSPQLNFDLFKNTIGGMGLTGIIVSVTLKLKKIETSYIKQKSLKAQNLDEVLSYFEQYKDYTYSVAWIDCLSRGKSLGRSLLMLGEHAKESDCSPKKCMPVLVRHSDKKINIPFLFPTFVLNRLSVRLFNFLYYHKQIRKETNKVIHYDPFFYPLDKIDNWNRIYGKKGFTQYQFVIPFENGKEGLKKILNKITASGCASFLAVLKTFGPADDKSSPLSFPIAGYTLALDFKMNDKVLHLLDELDVLVKEYNGRLYLTKDSRMKKDFFHETYTTPFSHPDKFCSIQSKRLDI